MTASSNIPDAVYFVAARNKTLAKVSFDIFLYTTDLICNRFNNSQVRSAREVVMGQHRTTS